MRIYLRENDEDFDLSKILKTLDEMIDRSIKGYVDNHVDQCIESLDEYQSETFDNMFKACPVWAIQTVVFWDQYYYGGYSFGSDLWDDVYSVLTYGNSEIDVANIMDETLNIQDDEEFFNLLNDIIDKIIVKGNKEIENNEEEYKERIINQVRECDEQKRESFKFIYGSIIKMREQDERDIENGMKPDSMIADENDWGF